MDNIAAHLSSISSPRSEGFDLRLHELLDELDQLVAAMPMEEAKLRKRFLDITEPLLGRSAVIAHGRNKPFGYSGDFQIIDWTYLQHIGSGDPVGALLDEFYHGQVAPKAVRDRKQRFGKLLAELASATITRPIRVLNVGSGPCREIIDGALTAGLSPADLRVTCIEIDARAIDYARGPAWARVDWLS